MSEFVVTVRQSMQGIVVDNVLGVQCSNVPGVEDCQGIAQAIYTAWNNDIKVHQGRQVELLGVDCISLDNPLLIGHGTGVENQGRIGPALPSFVCVKVDVLTGSRGRSFRGRFGLAAVLEADTQDDQSNLLTTGALAGWQTQLTLFGDDASTALAALDNPGHLAVISKYHQGQKRPVPIGNPATALVVRPEVGSRNSRKK